MMAIFCHRVVLKNQCKAPVHVAIDADMTAKFYHTILSKSQKNNNKCYLLKRISNVAFKYKMCKFQAEIVTFAIAQCSALDIIFKVVLAEQSNLAAA